MNTFLAVLLIFILIAVAGLVYVRIKAEKNKAAELKAQTQLSKKLQLQFRDATAKLSSLSLVDPISKQKITAIASNYFVFQPINEINLQHFKEIVELFCSVIDHHVTDEMQADEDISQVLLTFTNQIPESTRDFSSQFYQSHVPGLIYDLAEQLKRQSLQQDSEEDSFNEEQDDTNETEPAAANIANGHG